MSRKYEASPIIEAICQFQFESDTSWDLTIPGLVYEKVNGIFPKRNQVEHLSIGLAASAGMIGQQIGALPLVQFIQENGRTLMQVGQNLLTINHLQPYTSWQEYLPLIEVGLAAYKETVHPKKLLRVALQYLNRIELENPVNLETYFKFYPFLGESLPQTHGAFVVGVQLPFENSRDLMNLQLTSVISNKPDVYAMILDLNYVLVQADEVELDNVMDWVSTAHTNIEATFEACITDQLRLKFKEVTE